jgi:hypothetical protein
MKETQDGDIDANIAGPVAKLRYIVVWIGRSSQRGDHWKELSDKLIQYDIDNRWNSTHDMIGDALRCRPSLIQLIKDYPNDLKEWALSQLDWQFLGQLYTVLHPFYDFTKLASEGTPKIGSIRSLYLYLLDLINKVKSREGEYAIYDARIIQAFQSRTVQSKFDKYNRYIEQCPIYLIASVLDPRIKGTLLQSEPDGETKLAEIQALIHRQYPSKRPTTQDSTGSSAPTSEPFELQLLRKVHKSTAPVSDIDRYFDSPIVAWDGKDDPNWVLKWWKANADLYPIMSRVARAYLAVPPAEVDVERLFSSGRDLIGLRRHSIKAETMKAVILARDEVKRQYSNE